MSEDDAEHLSSPEGDGERHPQGSSQVLDAGALLADHPRRDHGTPGSTGGHIKAAIVEAQDECANPRYAVFVLASWRSSYHVLRIHWPARPRLFRDVDRLLALLRMAYGFKGPVAFTIASPDSEKAHTRMAWRVSV